jgi:hypothetical protein
MTIAVRRATTADAELVSSLNADVQALHAAAVPWRFKPPGPDTFPSKDAEALLAKSGHVAFIAELRLSFRLTRLEYERQPGCKLGVLLLP